MIGGLSTNDEGDEAKFGPAEEALVTSGLNEAAEGFNEEYESKEGGEGKAES